MASSSSIATNEWRPLEFRPLLLRRVAILRSYVQQCRAVQPSLLCTTHAPHNPNEGSL